MITRPRILCLDSSTLGKLAEDACGQRIVPRSRANEFLQALEKEGVLIGISLVHLIELMRGRDWNVIEKRIEFLRSIRLVAWVKPLDGAWFPGSDFCLAAREMRGFLADDGCDWSALIESGRELAWQTGTGNEIIPTSADPEWPSFIEYASSKLSDEVYIASIARTDPGHIANLTIEEARKLPRRDADDRSRYRRQFAIDLSNQLSSSGDRRLSHKTAASGFAVKAFGDVEKAIERGQDFESMMIEDGSIPSELIGPTTTIAELGEYRTILAKYKALGEALTPPVKPTLKQVPVSALPSVCLDRAVRAIQRKAHRVSGSDLNDLSLLTLSLYADIVEVDKRTYEYLKQVRQKDRRFEPYLARVIRTRHYWDILAK